MYSKVAISMSDKWSFHNIELKRWEAVEVSDPCPCIDIHISGLNGNDSFILSSTSHWS